MLEQALQINPEIQVTTFPQGLNKENMQAFLKGVDVYVDGLDAFVLDVRADVFVACQLLGIPAVTVAPIGMGAALLNFMPDGMSFEDYFGLSLAKTEMEKIARFILGLTPSGIQTKGMADRSAFKLREKKGGSTTMGCSLATGVLGTEILKILLGRGKVSAAPDGIHFDAFSNQIRRTWMPFGSRNPIFRLKLAIFNRVFMKTREQETAPAEDDGLESEKARRAA
jgi:molybdopterin/thiamine biosynthesis adenylyltransferase